MALAAALPLLACACSTASCAFDLDLSVVVRPVHRKPMPVGAGYGLTCPSEAHTLRTRSLTLLDRGTLAKNI